MLALRQVAKAHGGVAAIARKSKLTREATYRMLSESGNPALRSLTAVLAATGLQLSIKPVPRHKAHREKTRRAIEKPRGRSRIIGDRPRLPGS
jgi:hypothetical protein